MRSDTAEMSSVPSYTLRTQYETLRMAALGEVLPVQARSGLQLFLHRGMWGWARTLAAATSGLNERTLASPRSPTALCERKAVVHLLAQIAMNTHQGRSP